MFCNKKVLVVAPIYDKIDKLEKLNEMSDNNTIFVFLGNLFFPNDNKIHERINKIQHFLDKNDGYYIIGKHDLLYLLNNKLDEFSFTWLNKQLNYVSFIFSSSIVLTIVHGGISPNINSWDKLKTFESSFVSKIENKDWHHTYNGLFGYVISALPHIKENIQYYNFSCTIDNLAYKTNKLFIQEYNKFGLQDFYII
jgi:hypothetical protein